jgi:hypothetical protein
VRRSVHPSNSACHRTQPEAAMPTAGVDLAKDRNRTNVPGQLALYLHAGSIEPEFVTNDPAIIERYLHAYGPSTDMLLIANELAELLPPSPAAEYLSSTENASMVRVTLR